jgi:hypothetical protein
MREHNTWIDFETEMSKLVQDIEKNGFEQIGYFKISGEVKNKKINDLPLYTKITEKSDFSGSFKDYLVYSLETLKLAFTEYLKDIVENFKVNKLQDILNIINLYAENGDVSYQPELNILNFNYTDTFKRLYEYCYFTDSEWRTYNYDRKVFEYFVHGSLKQNEIVLGIDEYKIFPGTDNAEFLLDYKKFYQRENVEGPPNEFKVFNNTTKIESIFVFGHSLDYTDREVLTKIFNLDNEKNKKTKIYIYYKDKIDRLKKIANIEKVLGTDFLFNKKLVGNEVQFIQIGSGVNPISQTPNYMGGFYTTTY